MNTKIMLAGGVLAGLVAGATLMGAAYASPQPASAFAGYRMMSSYDASGTSGVPTLAQMNSFMDRYRTAGGTVDVNRMHADVARGTVKPPCVNRRAGSGVASTSRSRQAAPSRGPAMMTGVSTGVVPGSGLGMMGSAY